MRKQMKIAFIVLTLSLFVCSTLTFSEEGTETVKPMEKTIVLMKTSMGNIKAELYADKAPVGVANFLSYVKEGFYTDVIFHRVIKNFMIQGGGFTKDMTQKETKKPIKNEADNGLKNDRGTLAYARTAIVDSATSQFFINTVDNTFLNHRDKTSQGYGYCVFGKVIEGLDVVDKIQNVSTTMKKGMKDVPSEPVVIESITLVTDK